MSTVVTSCMSKLLRAKLTTVGTIVNDVLEVGKDHVHGIWVSDPLLSVLYGWGKYSTCETHLYGS